MNRKALLPIFVSLGVFFVIFGVVALYLWNASRQDVATNSVNQAVTTLKEMADLKVTDQPISPTKQVIGGDLKVTGNVTIIDGLSSSSLQLIPVTDQANLRTGQLYTTDDSSLYYYNGRVASNISGGLSNAQSDIAALQEETQRFLNQPEAVLTLQGQSGNIVLSGSAGITITGTTIANNGVLTVQGRAGNVQFVSGNGIEINGTTITNSGVMSIGGQNGTVSLGNGLSISNGALVNTGITQLISGSADITVSNSGGGSYTISYAGSGVGGTVALAPNASQEDSSNNASIAFNKTGLGNLIQISTGTNATNKFVVDQSGAIINGSINFSQVTGAPSLVNSIAGLTGTVGVGQGLAVSGGQIVATTAVNNLVGTANQVNITGSGTLTLSLPQNIATTSSPTFAGLTLTSALTVANGGTGSSTAAGARTNLGAAASGANSDITALTGLTSALSVAQGGTGTNTLTQNGVLIGNGTAAISTVNASAANQCLVSNGAGAVSFQACPGAGGVTSLNGKSGAVVIAGVDPTSIDATGTSIVIRDASYTTKGLASFNSTNFAVLNGSVNTAQNINIGATPTFAGLNLTAALSVANGGTGRSTFEANSLLLGQGTGALGTLGTVVANQCLVSGTGGALGFATCPGSTGVTSVNGLTGSVSLSTASASSLSQVGNTVTIRDATDVIKGLAAFNADNFVVTNGVVNTVQNISSSATPSFAGLNLDSALSVSSGGTGRTTLTANSLLIGNGTGAVSMLTAPSAGLCLASGTGGTLSFVTCPGAEVVNTINGTSGPVTLTAVDPLSINTTGATITIRDASYTTKGLASFNGSNFSVTNGAVNTVQDIGTAAAPTFEGLTLTSALGVTSGGTGASSFAANSLLIGQGTAAVTTLGTSTAGQCLISGTGGYLSFSACPGSNGVTSLNGLLGALTVRGVSASSVLSSGSTITIANASDTVKGLASFNGANLVVTNGVVNTIQDISVNAAPTFAELTLTSPLAVSSGGTGATSFALNGVVVGNGGSGLNTVSATGENQCLISGAGGTLSFITCPGAGGVTSLNGLQGVLTLNAADPNSIASSGSTITLRDATNSRKGLASFDASNFTVVNGAVNLVQDIGTGATPTFAGLNLGSALSVTSGGTGASNAIGARTNLGAAASGANTDITSLGSVSSITSSAGLALNANGGALTLQGASTVLSQNNGANSTQLVFQTPTANVTYTLQTAAAGTYEVCTTAGNCIGAGGGVTTLGGTIGKLSRFVSGSAIGDSIITDNGTSVSIDGALSVNNITPTAAAIIGATTQSLTLQGSTTSITSTGSASTNTLTFATPSGANKTIVIPNASGTIAISASGPLTLDANGNLSCASCLTSGGGGGGATGVSSVNGITGDVTITSSDANSITAAGTTITIADASATRKGIAAFNSANLVVTNGVVNTVQNIGTGATPTFAGINLTAPLTVANGGTGRANLPKGLVIGNGTAAVDILAPTGASECLASDSQSNLVFVACPGTSVVNYINGLNGTVTLDATSASSVVTNGNNIRIQDASASIKGLASFNSSNLVVTAGVVNTIQDISTASTPSFNGLSLSTALGIASGGTGSTTASGARTSLGAAARGANSDITSLSGLTTALSVAQGGTGQLSLSANRVLLGNGTAGIAVSNAAGTGQCLVGNSSGAPSFQACPGSDGVRTLNSLNGDVTIDTTTASSLVTSGNNIRIQDATSLIKGLASFDGNNLTIVNGSVNTAQSITTSATPTFAGLNLTSALGVASGGTGRTSLAANGVVVGQGTGAVTTVGTATAGQCLVSGSGGVLSFASCPGAGGVTSVNGLSGAVTVDSVTASSLLISGNNIRIQDATASIKGLASFNADSLTVTNGNVNTVQSINTSAAPTFAGLTLTTPLGVASGGTGRSTLASGSLLIGNGSGAVSTLGTSVAGKCLVSGAAGALSFLDCPGTDVVNSINGASGAITVTAVDPSSVSTVGGVITVRDASYTTKGLASFNGGNFIVSNGAVNTVQNIATTSSPTFAGLTLSSALGVANGGTGAGSFAANGLLVGQGTSALTTVGTATAGQCLVSGTGGVLSFAACPGSGGVSSFNGLTGAVTVATTSASSLLTSGNTVTIADATDTVKGLAAFNATNLTVSGGVVNTVQNIATTSTPTFAGLTLSSALSVPNGGTGRTTLTADRVLLGNGASGIAVSNEALQGYCLIGNASGAPTFQACPVGGNISSGTAQTPGVVAMFDTTTNQITNSIISQAGSVVTVDGQLSATTLSGNGAALTNLNASNIATGTIANGRLSANVTLQGNTFNGNSQLLRLDSAGATTQNGLCLMSTGSGTGTAFQSCPGSGAEVGANTALSNLSNVAINDMLLPGASNTIDIGSTTRAFRNLYMGGTITAAGAINGITLTSTALQSAGALSLSAGGTNQAITVAGSGSGGVTINPGTGSIRLTGVTCNTSANGGKLTTNASGVLGCADDIGGVSVVGVIDSQTASANGAVINGNTIYLQTASATSTGVVSTSAQTFGGDKTFAGATTLQGATTMSGTVRIGNAAMGVLYTDDSGNVQKAFTSGATVGQCLAYTAPNTVGFQNCSSGSGSNNAFLQGGNAFNAAATLGVTDNQGLTIIQNNQSRIAMPNDGNIVITPMVNKFVFINTTAADSEADLIVNGRVKSLTGFKVGTVSGVSIAQCSGYIQNAVVSGGIITGGNCSTGGSAGQAIVQGGNAFNGTLTMGTTDNFGINIVKQGTTMIGISQDGNIDFSPSVNKWVRIGTTNTDGSAQLIVNGRIKSLTGFRVNNSDGVTLTCANGNQTLGAPRFEGGILVQASCSTNNSDLAENYSSTQQLAPAEIVMAAGTSATAVVRATGENAREKMMGVVSTEPGQTLGTEQVPEGYPIALTGRVPVKVNGEGGAIGIGDKITLSSVAGVGMKATTPGMIVGTAVETFNGVGQGSIEVFVNLMYWSPVDGNNLQAQVGTFGSLNVSGHTTLTTLTVTSTATFQANIIVNGHIITGGGAPNYSVGASAGAGAAVVVDGNDTAGTIKITTGSSVSAGSLANLVFSQTYGKSPRIIISGQDDASLNARIFPAAKTAGGFTLDTSQVLAPNTTYTFDYFIVE